MSIMDCSAERLIPCTVGDIAKVAGLTPYEGASYRLRKMREDGLINPVRVGRALFVRESDAVEIARRLVPAAA